MQGTFWNIGTALQPVIQGQAGKPFIHQRGPLIRFPNSEQQIDNSCLCKYRYLRYFAFYAKVDEEGSDSIVVFQDFTQNEKGFLNYSTKSEEGYRWELSAGPIYLGCHPKGTFQTGKWLRVSLPYKEVQEGQQNQATPSPYCLQSPAQTEPFSLLCMIVSSYKCCNGQDGCGIEIPRGSDSWYQSAFPLCVAQYFVTDLDAQNREPVATLIKGTTRCICTPPYKVQRKYIQHNCSSATVRAFKQMNILPGPDFQQDCQLECIQCIKDLQQVAKSWAKQEASKNKCVWWVLWKWDYPENCDPCIMSDFEPSLVQDFSGVPSQVLGKGGGWLPLNFHNTQRKDYCNPSGGGVSYQWAYLDKKWSQYSPNDLLIQLAAIMPESITQNPCKDWCTFNSELGNISDSLSGLSSNSFPQDQLPCNQPNPPSQVYLQYTYQDFNVWSLKLQEVQHDPLDPYSDPCYKTYKVADDSLKNGKLDWVLQQTAALDYQLQEKGYFWATQFIHFKSGKFLLPLDIQQDPPETASDSRLKGFNFHDGLDGIFLQKSDENLCHGVYQAYLMRCYCQDPCSNSCSQSQKEPLIASNTCAMWRYLGKVSAQQMQQRGICTQAWQISTIQNTFSDPIIGPVGQLVYTKVTNNPYFCDTYPSYPQKNIWYAVATITPITESSDSIQWSVENISFGYCSTPPQVIEGFKSENDPQAAVDITAVQDILYPPSDCCQIYWFKLLGVYPDVQTSSCQNFQPFFDKQQDLGQLSIAWNYPVCLNYKLYVLYAYVQISLSCQNAETGGFDDPLSWQLSLRTIQPVQAGVRPSISNWKWGWLVGGNPAQDAAAVVQGTSVYPRTTGSTQNLCTLYYVFKIDQVWGRQAPSIEYTGNYPDLRNSYTIVWNYTECLGSSVRKYVRWRYASFSPTCAVPGGIPSSGSISWHYQISNYLPQNQSIGTFGWKASLSAGQLLPVNNNHVDPGTSCTVYYTQYLQQRIHCGEPEDWSPDSSFPLPSLDVYTIDWDLCRCLQRGRWVVMYTATVQPLCQADSNGNVNKVTWGASTASFLCSDTTSQQSGWYNTNGTTSLPITGGAVQPGSLCSVHYKHILFDGTNCGTPSAMSPGTAITSSLGHQSIAWTEACKGVNTYLHWMVYSYGPTCSIVNRAVSSGKSQGSSAYTSGTVPTIIEGWKNVPSPFSSATGSASAAGCAFYYIKSLASYKACSASSFSDPTSGVPVSSFTTSWPQSCNLGSYFQDYCVTYASISCGNQVRSSFVRTKSFGKSSANISYFTNGWRTTSDPFAGSYIGTSATACSAYYISSIGGVYYACQSSNRSCTQSAPYNLVWPSSCNPAGFTIYIKQYAWGLHKAWSATSSKNNLYLLENTPVQITWSTPAMTRSVFSSTLSQLNLSSLESGYFFSANWKPASLNTNGGGISSIAALSSWFANPISVNSSAANGTALFYVWAISSCMGDTNIDSRAWTTLRSMSQTNSRLSDYVLWSGFQGCLFSYAENTASSTASKTVVSLYYQYINRTTSPVLGFTNSCKKNLLNHAMQVCTYSGTVLQPVVYPVATTPDSTGTMTVFGIRNTWPTNITGTSKFVTSLGTYYLGIPTGSYYSRMCVLGQLQLPAFKDANGTANFTATWSNNWAVYTLANSSYTAPAWSYASSRIYSALQISTFSSSAAQVGTVPQVSLGTLGTSCNVLYISTGPLHFVATSVGKYPNYSNCSCDVTATLFQGSYGTTGTGVNGSGCTAPYIRGHGCGDVGSVFVSTQSSVYSMAGGWRYTGNTSLYSTISQCYQAALTSTPLSSCLVEPRYTFPSSQLRASVVFTLRYKRDDYYTPIPGGYISVNGWYLKFPSSTVSIVCLPCASGGAYPLNSKTFTFQGTGSLGDANGGWNWQAPCPCTASPDGYTDGQFKLAWSTTVTCTLRGQSQIL